MKLKLIIIVLIIGFASNAAAFCDLNQDFAAYSRCMEQERYQREMIEAHRQQIRNQEQMMRQQQRQQRRMQNNALPQLPQLPQLPRLPQYNPGW